MARYHEHYCIGTAADGFLHIDSGSLSPMLLLFESRDIAYRYRDEFEPGLKVFGVQLPDLHGGYVDSYEDSIRLCVDVRDGKDLYLELTWYELLTRQQHARVGTQGMNRGVLYRRSIKNAAADDELGAAIWLGTLT